jgi:trehalose 6-phosphate synthase
VVGTEVRWLAAALSEGDRVAAREGLVEAEGLRVRLLDLDPTTFRLAYDVVCNAALWFVHHGLFDTPHRPRYDHRWTRAWDAYRTVNEAFADAVSDEAPDGATVLVQDYHLTLVAPRLRSARPDLRLVHFSHTPFAGPDDLARLPTAAAREMLEGLAAHHACGFHAGRWARRFEQSWAELGPAGDEGATPHTFVAPHAPDPDDLAATLAREATRDALDDLDRRLGDRAFVVRVDRIELSKNVLRGLHAFDLLLEREPGRRGRVVFGAFLYPSREGLPEYLAYRQEVETLIERINERWGSEDWTPVLADLGDDYPRSVAALVRYDVLVVNPVRDGLNLVAKEGPLVNRRDGVVVLSREAGAHPEMAGTVLSVNPFDVAETADAIARALDLGPSERSAMATAARRAAGARVPADWLADQRAAAR